MKNWFRRSIRNKLTALVLLAVVPSVLLASVLSEWRESNRRLESKRNEIAGIAEALAATVSEPLATGDRRQTANALKGIGSIPGLTHVSVADSNGARVFQFGAGIVVSEPHGLDNVLNLGTYPVETPVIHAGREIGKLTLIADLSEVLDGYYRGLAFAALAALASALAGLAASHRMLGAIANPIRKLTGTMRLIASTRDFKHSIEATTSDETGVLVESFNAMLAEIRTRDAELTTYHEGLEKLVDERTRDLAVATKDAERANAAKSEFLATMSHEIRTPMNGMLVMAELLSASDLTPRARRQCDVILRSGQTLLAIINDILDLSKIEAGRMTLETLPVDPVQVVDDTLRLFSERASGKGLQVASYIAHSVPETIEADPVRLGQVLSNLVNNALKFTEHGGITVTVERIASPHPCLRIGVADTGIGIPDDKIATIFDPFTQAEQSTTRRFGGTGIGLSICRRLVEAMGGELRVRSTVGIGSEFWFEIPAEPAAITDAEPTTFSGTVLLLAEPGPLRDVVALISKDLGLAMVEMNTRATPEDLAVLRSSAPRLALVPANTNAAAIAELHMFDCPIIAITSFGDAAGDQLLRSGAVRDVIEVPLAGREARAAMIAALTDAAPITVARSTPASTGEQARSFAGARILAADDSAINREVLLEALSRLGADVTFVEDGAEAVSAVISGSFDLVFMDGSMPVLDGFTATREIRAWETAHGRAPTPIVGLSAHVFAASGEVWQSCGMSDFITKPFTLAAIRNCLERWLPGGFGEQVTQAGDGHTSCEFDTAGRENDAILDESVLQSIAEMQSPGDDLVARVVGLYLEHAPRALERLAKDYTGGAEAKTIAAAAHALKSLSRNVGARKVGELCGQIEDDARNGRQPRVDIEAVGVALGQTIARFRDDTAMRRSCG